MIFKRILDVVVRAVIGLLGIGGLLLFAAIATSNHADFDVPCVTDSGTVSYAPSVCEKYGRR